MVLLTGTVLGCGGAESDRWTEARPNVHRASGIVTLDGAPLAGATVTFRRGEDSPAAAGRTDAEGRFQLSTFGDADGAVAGPHQATVTKYSDVEKPAGYDPETSPPLPEPKLLTPPKYQSFETSGLSATVSPDGPNEFEFTLTSK